MKILLAVDGSAFTQKMLDYLASHQSLCVPEHAFTVLTVQLPLPPRARAALGALIVQDYHEEEAKKITTPVSQFLNNHQIQAQVVFEVGNPGEVIAATAQSGGFDLIMMGSHGHGALGSLVMGSVATTVIAQCEVPVLLVR